MSFLSNKNFIWSAIGRFLGILSLVLINAHVARELSIKDFAMYNFIMSLIPTFFTILTFGQDTNSSKLLSANNNPLNHYVNVIVLFFLSLLICLLPAFLFFNDLMLLEKNLFVLILYIVISSSVLRICSDLFRANDNFSSFILFNSIRSSGGIIVWISFVIQIVYLYQKSLLTIESIFFSLAFSNFMALFLMFLFNYKIFFQIKSLIKFENFSSSSFNKFFSSSLLIFLSTFLVIVKSDFDFWIVSSLGRESDLAFYAPVIKISALILVPLSVFESFLPRSISKLYHGNSKIEFEKFIRSINTLMFYSSFFVLIAIFSFSSEIIYILYGSNFLHLSLYLKLVVIAFLPKILFGPCGQILLLTEYEKLNFKINLFFLIITFILGGILTSIYGFMGMLIVFSFSIIAINLVFYIAVLKCLKINTLPFMNYNKIDFKFLK